jgi:protein AbiQ
MSFTITDIKFYTVDTSYIETLYAHDSEVYRNIIDPNYGRKPYIGILTHINGRDYLIPLTSPKNKHKNWDYKSDTSFLVYETINNSSINTNDIFKIISGSTDVNKILSVIDIKKMIPVKNGLYTYIDISIEPDLQYRSLLTKEYQFIKSIRHDVIQSANTFYNKILNGESVRFGCNLLLLETICDTYTI